jgi:hypothetical protein
VVDSNEWYVVCLAGARRMQKTFLGWKEPRRGNCGHRADEVSELDLMGTGYPTVEKELEFCLAKFVCESDSGQDFNYVIASVVCTDQTSDFNYFA